MFIYLERLEAATWVNCGSIRVGNISHDILSSMKRTTPKALSEPMRSYFVVHHNIIPIVIELKDLPSGPLRREIYDSLAEKYHNSTIRVSCFRSKNNKEG